MELKLKIGQLLRERNMTVTELAARAGIARATARSLAGGFQDRVDLPVLQKVADALGVRPLELFEEVEDTPGKARAMAYAA
jgi:DNA-binding Xre family transcriptional regulator